MVRRILPGEANVDEHTDDEYEMRCRQSSSVVEKSKSIE